MFSIFLGIIFIFVPQIINIPSNDIIDDLKSESEIFVEKNQEAIVLNQNEGDRMRLPSLPKAGLRTPEKLSENRSLGIETTAKAALVYDVATGAVLFEKNADEKLSLASITKLMTALVFLDTESDWKNKIELKKEDDEEGGIFYARSPEKIRRQDLFNMMLIGSTNNAAIALSRSSGFKREEFIEKMNVKSKELGLGSLFFTDSSGLDSKNIGTAKDVAKLLFYALQSEKIREAIGQERYIFKVEESGKTYYVKSTDDLLSGFLNRDPYKIIGGKTGYTNEAGYNLAVEIEKEGHRIIVVVLGSASAEDRFSEVKGLSVWTFENYKW
jgi:D-alanyl-D-alanine carboxypeptidase